jgi:hypothetical protein
MGAVYRAYDRSTGRQVAIKVALRRLGPKALARFRREGEISASLSHTGIVRVHTAGEHEGMPYIAYELVENCQELDQAFEGSSRAERLRMLRDAARALGHAHSKGIVHRDVKPGNLLVDAEGRVRVADFGLVTFEGADRLTRTGALVGTPFYMAPEQFGGTVPPAPTHDVWALGVVLYQALTDRLPFEAANLGLLASAIANADPTPPRALDASISPSLEAVCLTALSRDPAQRYRDGDAFADAVDKANAGERVSYSRRLSPRLVWALLPVAALAVLAAAFTYEPAPPAPLKQQARGEPETAAPPPKAIPSRGWYLERGGAFVARLKWNNSRRFRGSSKGKPPSKNLVNVLISVSVREIRAGVATLDATFQEVSIGGTDATFSSRDSGAAIPLRRAVGKTFVIRLDVPSGSVRRVLGLTAIRGDVIGATAPVLRSIVTTVLSQFDDQTFRKQLSFMFGVNALGPDPKRWSHERVFWLRSDIGLGVGASLRAAGPAIAYELDSWRTASILPGEAVQSPRGRGTALFRSGLLVESRVTVEAHVTRSVGEFDQVFEIHWLVESP